MYNNKKSYFNDFMENIKIAYIKNFYSDKQKIEYIQNFRDSISYTGLQSVFYSIASFEDQIKCLKDFDDQYKEALIRNFKRDEDKIKCLQDSTIKISDYSKALIIGSFEKDEDKIKYLKDINDDYYKATIIGSFKEDEDKIKYLKDFNDDYYKVTIIKSFKEDEDKIKCLKDIDDYSKADVIGSFEKDEDKIKCLQDSTIKISDYSKAKIIKSFEKDEDKIKYLKDFSDDKYKAEIISSFEKDEDKIKYLKDFSDDESKAKIIRSINDFNEKLFKTEFSDEFIKLLFSAKCLPLISPNLQNITNDASSELYVELNGLLNGIQQGNSIDNLKRILLIQAKNDFEAERLNEPNKFLQADLAETIVHSIGSKTKKEIQENIDLTEKKAKIIETINSSYDITLLKKILESINNQVSKKSEADIITIILNKSNINGDLRLKYEEILNKSINQELINEGNAEEILNIIKEAAKKIVSESFEDENNRKIGGLLTQVCTHALNIQQIKEVNNRFEELKNIVKNDLKLTEKGLNKIKENRLRAKLGDNLAVYLESYNVKTLINLYDLMVKDERYRDELIKEITPEEKATLQLNGNFFEINEKLQKQRILFAILDYLNTPSLPVTNSEGKLSESVKARINEIATGIVSRNGESSLSKEKNISVPSNKSNAVLKSRGIELLCGLSKILDKETTGYLLTFYEKAAKRLNTNPEDNNGIRFNAENLNKYVEMVRKMAMTSVKDKLILGSQTFDILERNRIKNNYEHYMNCMSKRVYRTIPNISGKVDSSGEEIQFRTYDVDDPEQLIAGVRITTLSSCFRIGGYQNDTIKYITSSPHGTIIAIEDKEGKFLGRVYGYRIGNAVHFTRIYYNKEFDYEKVISQIGQSIIDGSKEIEHVTAIPHTCNSREYIANPIKIKIDKSIISPQENPNSTLKTDHDITETVALIASKTPKEIKFNRSEPTEKFYKERKNSRAIDLKIATEEEISQVTRFNIIAGTEDFFVLEENLSQAILGDGWCIFIANNGLEYSVHKIEYKDETIDNEIAEEIKKAIESLKIKQQVKTQDELLSQNIGMEGGMSR